MRIYAHSLFHFISIWTNLNETQIPYSCGIKMLSLNDEKLKKSNLILLKSSVRIYAHSLFHFIPIWTNLNETNLPYSCSIKMLSLNDERLKNWNPSLSKCSMCMYAHSLFHFIPIWTNLNETQLPYSFFDFSSQNCKFKSIYWIFLVKNANLNMLSWFLF